MIDDDCWVATNNTSNTLPEETAKEETEPQEHNTGVVREVRAARKPA